MRPRDTAWVDLADKRRPAVVIEVAEGMVRVAYGTRTSRAWAAVTVHPTTRSGRSFPLVEVTYFYGPNTAWERPEALERGLRPVPLDLLIDIRMIVDEYDASLLVIASDGSIARADADPPATAEPGGDED